MTSASLPARLAALLLLAPLPAGAAFNDLGAGARAPGMGNAFVAVADDVTALHYNPAGLGLLKRPELGAAYTQHHVGLSDSSNLSTSFLGYAQPLSEGRLGTLAAAWSAFSLDAGLYREDSFYLSYGRLCLSPAPGGELYAGASLKYLRSSFGAVPEASAATDGIVNTGLSDPVLSGRNSQGAVDADLGLLYRFGGHYAAGLHAAHVNRPDTAFAPGDKDRLPTVLKLGVNYRSLLSNLVVQAETAEAPDGSLDRNATFAAERWFPTLFAGEFGVRGAFSAGSREFKRIDFGLSYRTRRLEFSYAFALPVQTIAETAGSHRAGLTFRFGRATDREESIEEVLEAMRQLKKRARVLAVRDRVAGLTRAQRAAYDEYMAQSASLLELARYKDAFDAFSQALTIVPPDKDLIARFGRLNAVSRRFPALPGFKSRPPAAALHQGIVAYFEGRDLAAVERVSLARNLDPGDETVEHFLVQLEHETGIRRLTGLGSTPKSLILETKITRAEAAAADKNFREAVELSLSAVREDPGRVRPWQVLGTSYFALQDYESSLRAWKRAHALEKSPAIRDAIQGYMKTIRRLLPRTRRSRGSAPLPSEPDMTSRRASELFNEGVDHYANGRLEKARAAFKRILEARPDHDEARKALRRVEDEMK